ncbi:hypothetical protein [Streptomyces blattellae]|uniref:hypothetical protein n=1 Tax=Streptomyces blattellae TaxID=2569855 RepID=UPI0012B8EC48|nr:hypothetical protein [Streptomyces blattellae]
MRRTVRALSVAALAGVLPVIAAAAALADPAAEVSPGQVSPGRSITVSVSCDPLGGPAPAAIDAASPAFQEGTVQLRRVVGNEDEVSGPAYSGTARIAAAEDLEDDEGVGPDSAWTVDGTCPAAPGGEGKPWSATFTVARGGSNGPCADPLDTACDTGKPCLDPLDTACRTGKPCLDPLDTACHTGKPCLDPLDTACHTGKPCLDPLDTACRTGKPCPEPTPTACHTGKPCPEPTPTACHTGKPCPEPTPTACHTGKPCPEPTPTACPTGQPCPVPRDPSCHTGKPCPDPHDPSCGGGLIEHGVHAGDGGAFNDSVPALVAGGLLIAGAFGGAVYRLWRKAPAEDG